jgi:hypothetical protein
MCIKIHRVSGKKKKKRGLKYLNHRSKIGEYVPW